MTGTSVTRKDQSNHRAELDRSAEILPEAFAAADFSLPLRVLKSLVALPVPSMPSDQLAKR